MKTEAGVWIDHRKAVVVILSGEKEETKEIASNAEKQVRYSGAASQDAAEDQRDRRFSGHLDKYYHEVVACLRHVGSLLILGPGEAKTELERRFEREGFRGQIVGLETVDKMTDPQIVARVRERFALSASAERGARRGMYVRK